MQIGWVDFSKADREKVLDVINMLQVRGAVDELGIGQVRDAFANHFFPGTSTVQTRAKYFLIVPYILQEAVTGKYGSDVSKILQRIDIEEMKCGRLLYQKAQDEGNNPGSVGIIGARVLPEKWVARKPSNIYWNGIRTYHIFKQENMSIPNMIRLSVLMRAQAKPNTLGNYRDGAREGEEDDRDAGYNETISFFDVPEMPESDWRDSLNISLTPNEAFFLCMKIEQSVPDTLLAYILKQHIDVSKYDSFEQLYAALKNDVPAEMKGMMKLACDFSRLVYAAYVRYNMMLSRGQNKEAVSEWEKITDHMTAYTGVDLDAVLSLTPRRDADLRCFLQSLQDALISNDIEKADRIIIAREKKLKDEERAKLCHAEDYDPNNWFGGRHLDYRFVDARRIINDIYEGMARSGSDS